MCGSRYNLPSARLGSSISASKLTNAGNDAMATPSAAVEVARHRVRRIRVAGIPMPPSPDGLRQHVALPTHPGRRPPKKGALNSPVVNPAPPNLVYIQNVRFHG